MANAVKENQHRPLYISHTAKPAAATVGPVILFTAGGVRFAVEASEVQEIRNSDERNQLHKPKGTELIDFAQRLGLGPGILERFVVLKPGECSLGVTEVERMTSLPKVVALPRLFRGAERQWYRGLLLLENEVVPLVRAEYWRKPPLPVQVSESGV
jgi:chemotaxis signal transduction protein